MTKISYKAQVYNMLKSASGEPVSVADFISKTGMTDYKLSAYIVNVKTDFGAVVVPIRDGRKVIAYRMVDEGTGIPAAKTRGRKASAGASVKKSIANVVVDQDPIVRASKVADIISDSIYEESPFEDQMFAEDFVRSL